MLLVGSTNKPVIKKNKQLHFGEYVEGFAVPVLNEREIRAAAGIMFLALAFSFVLVLFKQDFTMVKYVVMIFQADFFIRIFASPRFSPLLIIGRFIVSRQVPEYVGAAPKKFAWKLGFSLSVLMFILLVALNSYSLITTVSCFACLIFLFFESAFGICLGCVFYSWFYKKKEGPCAGEICEVKNKQAIQQVSKLQLLVVFTFLLVMLALAFAFNDQLQSAPRHLTEIISTGK